MSDSPSPVGVSPAGWYPDPWAEAWWRWWDGSGWTGFTDAVAATPRRAAPGAPVRAGGIAALGLLVGLALSTVVGVGLLLAGASRDGPVLLLGSTLALWTGLVGACLVAVRRKGSGSLRDLGLLRFRVVDPLLGLGFGVAGLIAVGIVGDVIRQLAPRLVPHDRTDLSGPLEHSGVLGIVVVFAIAAIGAPFVEELFFRGLVQTTLVARWGPATGIVVQALIFGSLHLAPDAGWGNVGTFVGIGLVGIGLGCMRYGFRRLDPGMAAHATYNALILVISLAVR